MVCETNQRKEGSQVLYQMLKKTIKFDNLVIPKLPKKIAGNPKTW